MMDMRICGSCHTLVKVEPNSVQCPRCQLELDPSQESILESFIESGVVATNRRGGVTLKAAQEAAKYVLGELHHVQAKLAIHHLGERCSSCPEEES